MFKGIVSLRSISNLYTKYGVSDIGWYGNRRGMGGADLWDSEDFIMSRSAIRFAPNVKTPILLVHSLEDYRCPFEQAEQFYVALKRLQNAPVELLAFKGENHELSRSGKPMNRMDRLRGIVDWFEKYVK
jgi:acylaminoacyl-peptidase